MNKVSTKAGRRRSNVSWRRRLMPYLFIAPNMAIFGTFIIYPALRGIWISFQESSDGRDFKYVGTANYKTILHDPTIASVAKNTATYVIFYVLISTLLGDEWTHGIETAIDMTLLGRYFERFADHAVSISHRVYFLVTGEYAVAKS